MLESTYIHCPGVGQKTERRLWDAGARTWAEYLRLGESLRLSSSIRERLSPLVEESAYRLNQRDVAWFARRLPSREHWRAYPFTRKRILYLDIETTGSLGAGSLTVVGLYDGYRLRQFVRGDNLEEFPEYVQQAEMLVTFNGAAFDLPFLRRSFGMEFPQLHIDLCFLLKRLGHSGGLKEIEKVFGLRRSGETQGMSGWDAVRLWYDYRRGDEDALRRLLAYNAEDVVNMETLLETAYPRMLDKLGRGAERQDHR